MTRHTWTELAGLRTEHPTLNVFDYDLSGMPEEDRTAFIAGEMAKMHEPLCRAQMACAHLGFVIGADGVDLMNGEALRLAHAFDQRLSQDGFLLSNADTQPTDSLAVLLGFDDEKSIQDGTWQVTQLVELISLIGQPADHLPMASTADETRAMMDLLADARIPKWDEPVIPPEALVFRAMISPKGYDYWAMNDEELAEHMRRERAGTLEKRVTRTDAEDGSSVLVDHDLSQGAYATMPIDVSPAMNAVLDAMRARDGGLEDLNVDLRRVGARYRMVAVVGGDGVHHEDGRVEPF